MAAVCGGVNRDVWAEPLLEAFAKFGLNTDRRRAAAMGQFLVEAGPAFREVVENLNYSAEQAAKIFPSIFPTAAAAAPFAHNQEKFGNRVYANRLGNGNEASGDGFRFRGRGLIQLTGRDEYKEFGNSIGKSPEEVSDFCETPEGAAMSGCWYLANSGLPAIRGRVEHRQGHLAGERTSDDRQGQAPGFLQRLPEPPCRLASALA